MITQLLSELPVSCQSLQHDDKVYVPLIIWHLFTSMTIDVRPVKFSRRG